MRFEEKLYSLRKRAGLSQEQLADKLEVSRQAVSRWEQGVALPDANNIVEISKIFCVSTDYLLFDEYNSDRDIPAVVSITRENELLYRRRMRHIVGGIITGLSTVGLIVLHIIGAVISSNGNYSYTNSSGQTFFGVYAFLKTANLFWLLILLIAGILIGLYIALKPNIEKWFNSSIDD